MIVTRYHFRGRGAVRYFKNRSETVRGGSRPARKAESFSRLISSFMNIAKELAHYARGFRLRRPRCAGILHRITPGSPADPDPAAVIPRWHAGCAHAGFSLEEPSAARRGHTAFPHRIKQFLGDDNFSSISQESVCVGFRRTIRIAAPGANETSLPPYAVNHFRPGPSFWRPENDHGPAADFRRKASGRA